MTAKRIGFFTRVLDDAPAAERYRLALSQITHAERAGFDSIWVAQHHFHEKEGGLPSPLVFLAYAAARTHRIRLGTGIITLPLEQPVRVAEDATVLDTLSGGRLELGFGSGGTPSSFGTFGTTVEAKRETYDSHLATVTEALRGDPILGSENHLYPASEALADRIWEATFSARGGAAAGARGNGLLLSRTQPATPENAGLSLSDIQNDIIDEYLGALPAGVEPRILASRTAFVADSAAEARRWAASGLEKFRAVFASQGHSAATGDLDDLIRASDTHLGTPDQVAEQLAVDTSLDRATDVSFQVHSVDPPHELILRHIELLAAEVLPRLHWGARLAVPAR